MTDAMVLLDKSFAIKKQRSKLLLQARLLGKDLRIIERQLYIEVGAWREKELKP